MRQSILSSEQYEEICSVLGRKIPASDEGGYGSFADFTEEDLNDLRLLGRASSIMAISYIRFKLKGRIDLNSAVAFYAAVIQQGVPLQEWINAE